MPSAEHRSSTSKAATTDSANVELGERRHSNSTNAIAREGSSQFRPRRGSTGDKPVSRDRESRSCCFCWCCCCSCSFLTVQNNEPGSNNERTRNVEMLDEKPSFDEVRAWGNSFDRLMRTGQRFFAEFLKCEYSDENILFWQACEDLKKERNPEKIEEKARIIYEDFISILSPKEVSLDSRVREIINNNMMHPTSHTFDEAQSQIYTLMHRDSYPRFVNSSLYKKLLSSYGDVEDL